jgi:hypothetical protein
VIHKRILYLFTYFFFIKESLPFHHEIDYEKYTDYKKHIVQPMSLEKIEQKIINRLYDTLDAILQDMILLVHNSFIYNGQWNKFTICAKRVIKLFKTQLDEIQTCSDCYINYMQAEKSGSSNSNVNSTFASSSTKHSINNKKFWFAELCVRIFFYLCFNFQVI